MIGSQHQILAADWLLYCALALLAGHSETNVSQSDTPGKLTLSAQRGGVKYQQSDITVRPARPALTLTSCGLRNQQQSRQFVRT